MAEVDTRTGYAKTGPLFCECIGPQCPDIGGTKIKRRGRPGGERSHGMGPSLLLRQERYGEEPLKRGQSTLRTDTDERDAMPLMNHIGIGGSEEPEV